MQSTEDLHAPLDPIAGQWWKHYDRSHVYPSLHPLWFLEFKSLRNCSTMFYCYCIYQQRGGSIQWQNQWQNMWPPRTIKANVYSNGFGSIPSNILPLTPLQPFPGAAETQWKQNLHQTNLHPLTTNITNPMINITDQIPTTSSLTQINLSLTKIATLFEQQATKESKWSELKEPSWACLTSPSKMMILHAMSTNGLDPAIVPTPKFNKSAPAAHQSLFRYFKANDQCHFTHLSPTLSTSLWSGQILGTPNHSAPFSCQKVKRIMTPPQQWQKSKSIYPLNTGNYSTKHWTSNSSYISSLVTNQSSTDNSTPSPPTSQNMRSNMKTKSSNHHQLLHPTLPWIMQHHYSHIQCQLLITELWLNPPRYTQRFLPLWLPFSTPHPPPKNHYTWTWYQLSTY